MQLNITKQVIELLCRQSPEFKLFFDTHFDLIQKQSLTPQVSKGKPSFPVKSVIIPKKLTFEEKMRYYERDVNKWNKSTKSLKGYVIIDFDLTDQTGESIK